MDVKIKLNIIVSSIAIFLLIIILVGATYAYFQAQSNGGSNTDVEIITYTTDTLTFYVGSKLEFSLDQESFAEGTGDKTASTFAKATLTPNNKTNMATDNYYVYLNITNNTFGYALESDNPEILLQVKDQNNTTVTSLDGLTYSTVTNGAGESVSGFDITTKKGLITLVNNKEITANANTKEETWNVTIVYVNYDENQTGNAGKSLSAKLMIQQEEEKISLANWVIEQYKTQTSGSETIYLHDKSLANGANDNSYRYAGSSEDVNNFVCFGSDAATCPDDNLYRIIGVFEDQVKLIKWDYGTSTLLGIDGDYKNTYERVSSGRLETSKGTNDQDAIGAYWWNNDGTEFGKNTWSASELNTVNLNTHFLNKIGTEWANKIATTTWKVGGNTSANIIESAMNIAYQNEIVSPATNTTESKKIGLMYASDYGFAAAPSAWTSNLRYYNGSDITLVNWMYMGLSEWTMVCQTGVPNYAFYVDADGYVNCSVVGYSDIAHGVRPVFHLASDVKYGSGLGSKANPVRLK